MTGPGAAPRAGARRGWRAVGAELHDRGHTVGTRTGRALDITVLLGAVDTRIASGATVGEAITSLTADQRLDKETVEAIRAARAAARWITTTIPAEGAAHPASGVRQSRPEVFREVMSILGLDGSLPRASKAVREKNRIR